MGLTVGQPIISFTATGSAIRFCLWASGRVSSELVNWKVDKFAFANVSFCANAGGLGDVQVAPVVAKGLLFHFKLI